MSPLLLLLLQLPILLLIMYLSTLPLAKTLPTLRNTRIALLIAHPDDEAMFFSPTVQALTDPSLNNTLVILCLSTGNAEGLGAVRSKELVSSALLLGVRAEEHVVLLDRPDFPDSMTAKWDAKAIADVLTGIFVLTGDKSKSKAPPKPSSSAPPKTTIDILLTFDPRGISSHPNHISLYHGARLFLSTLTTPYPGWTAPLHIYTLTSVPVWRKYASVLDAVFTTTWAVVRNAYVSARGRGGGGKGKGGSALLLRDLVVVSAPRQIWLGQRAMTHAHRSQMRWFRWGWIGVSRYMVVNELRRMG